MKPSDAVKLVGKLAAAFPHAKLGEGEQMRETLQVYAEALGDLELEDAYRAVMECIAECRFFPTVAEIRGRVANAALQLPPAELAWNEVLSAVGRYGIYRTPEFENPLTAIAVSNVGWKAICNSTKVGIERAHFLRAYEQATELAKYEVNTARLLEHVNAKGLQGLADDNTKRSGRVPLSATMSALLEGGEGE